MAPVEVEFTRGLFGKKKGEDEVVKPGNFQIFLIENGAFSVVCNDDGTGRMVLIQGGDLLSSDEESPLIPIAEKKLE